jgi:hypothetical protein
MNKDSNLRCDTHSAITVALRSSTTGALPSRVHVGNCPDLKLPLCLFHKPQSEVKARMVWCNLSAPNT